MIMFVVDTTATEVHVLAAARQVDKRVDGLEAVVLGHGGHQSLRRDAVPCTRHCGSWLPGDLVPVDEIAHDPFLDRIVQSVQRGHDLADGGDLST